MFVAVVRTPFGDYRVPVAVAAKLSAIPRGRRGWDRRFRAAKTAIRYERKVETHMRRLWENGA